MFAMILNDGTKIENLTIARNIIWSDEQITAEMLRGKLTPVTITGTADNNDGEDWDGLIGKHEHMKFVYSRPMDGKFALALADIPNDKWEREKLRANQEYIAMMSGIQL